MPLALTVKKGQSVKLGDVTLHIKKSRQSGSSICLVITGTIDDLEVSRLGYTEEAGASPEKLKKQEERRGEV